MAEMIDDRDGLYSHASEAVEEGRTMGRQEMFEAIRRAISPLYVEAERLGDPTRFHALDDALRVTREVKEQFDRPKAAL